MFRAARFLAALLVVGTIAAGGIVGGCIATASSPPTPAVTAASRSTAAVSAAPESTTRTAWGPILDALPPAFLSYPGSALANGVTTEPVTSALSTTASVATVVTWYGKALGSAGYRRTSLSTPAEDGSVVGEWDGGSIRAGCRARITFEPQGASTFILALVAPPCG